MRLDPRGAAAGQHAARAANERFGELVGDRVVAARLIPFLCECADPDCLGRVEMTLADYGSVHRDRTLFVIMPGHAMTDGELPIEARLEFDIVSKPETV
jgi:hypothetical protein